MSSLSGTPFWRVCLLAAVLLASCSQGIDREYYREMDRLLYEHQAPKAAELVQLSGPEVYGELNRLLYYMDLAMALQLSDQFEASAQQFEAAYRLSNDLYTQSISSEVASIFTSDNSIPYYGEEFERVLIHVFNALNYAYAGDVESAQVEAKRVDLLFKTFSKGRYEFDPFALFLSGMVSEAGMEPDDAWISYKRAYDAYLAQEKWLGVPLPKSLVYHWQQVARQTGRELPADVQQVGGSVPEGAGELVVFHYVGPGPRKIERFLEISVGEGFGIVQSMDIRGEDQKTAQQALSAAKGLASSTQVTLSYPVFEQPPLSCGSLSVEAAGCKVVSVELVHRISALAAINLEDRIKGIWGRLVARAVVKFVTAQAAGAVGEQLSGNSFFGNLISAVTQAALSAVETADIRGWRTIPAEIWMTRLVCQQGSRQIRVRQMHRQFGEVYDELPDVPITPGQTTFRYAACY